MRREGPTTFSFAMLSQRVQIAIACMLSGVFLNAAAQPLSTTTNIAISRPLQTHRLISAGELQKELEIANATARPLVIDVRSQGGFAACRIAGAMNLPLSLLRTKSFYKSRHIVLVNCGYENGTLLDEAATLEKAGFPHVRVLEGGLVAWRAFGGQFIGENPADVSWAMLTAEEAHDVVQKPNWLVVDAGGTPSKLVSSHFANSLHLPHSNDFDSYLKDVAKASSGRKGINRILITELSRDEFRKLSTSRDGTAESSPLYFLLDGGAVAYSGYLNREHRIQNRQPTTLVDQGIMNRRHDFESSNKGRSCCGGSK